MLKFLKSLFPDNDAPFLQTPVTYPGAMAEMVEYLILLQAPRSAANAGKSGNLLRLADTLSKDPYCLGYMAGMFESLCHQWEVTATERRLVIGSATTLMFRDLLDKCDPRSALSIEDAAFNSALMYAADPAYLRGKFDGCTELTRYAATKDQRDMPAQLQQHLQHLTESACSS